MADLGFGESGFGSAGYGYGDPESATSARSRIFIKADGTQGDCAYIDPKTRNYVLDDRGNKLGWDSIRQRVYLALRTKLGTSCVTDQGVDFPTGIITGDLALKNKNAVNAALRSMVDANLIEVVRVLTTRIGQGAVRIQVDWKIVETGQIVSDFV